MQPAPLRYRVLVIDDNAAIHEDLRKILTDDAAGAADLDALEAELLGGGASPGLLPKFEIDSAFQGQEGLQRVEAALAANDPYALAFVDVRMPPGWDGIETVERIWQVAPDLHVTLCTAYTDYGWDDIVARLPHSDQLLILKKPFEIVEARQIAACMAAKWTNVARLRGQIVALEEVAHERGLAAARAIELANMQARFVALASHEIRTPLCTVFAAVESLARYAERMTPEQREQRVTKIRLQVEHLTALLDDVLAIKPIEGNTPDCHPEPVDLDDFCREVTDQVESVRDRRGRIVAAIDPGPPMALDPTLGRQILGNLLTNALKYSPDDAPVHLTVSRQADAVTIRVADRGIGIPPDDQARLFEPFHRAANVGRVPGSGLGMTVVRSAVERHGGRIDVTSAVGEGTTVEVTLPASAGANAADRPAPPATPPPAAPLAR